MNPALQKIPASTAVRHIKEEVARRLTELRTIHYHGQSPEEVTHSAKEQKHIEVSSKTLRALENPELCNPTLETMLQVLAIYDTTLGDFFRFNATTGHSALVGQFLKAIEDDELRKALKIFLSRLQFRPNKTTL